MAKVDGVVGSSRFGLVGFLMAFFCQKGERKKEEEEEKNSAPSTRVQVMSSVLAAALLLESGRYGFA